MSEKWRSDERMARGQAEQMAVVRGGAAYEPWGGVVFWGQSLAHARRRAHLHRDRRMALATIRAKVARRKRSGG